MTADPAGLIERIPELEPLASADPKLRRAIASGSAHAVYRRIWWSRRLGGLREHREVVDALLERRRLFLEPVRSAPFLATLNGFGARVYGDSERDHSDGTYVTSYFITGLWVPLFPLSAYLVADGEGAGRSWHFIGKVPLGPLLYLWQRLLALLALGGIVVGAATAFYASRHNDIQVVNGLPLPVKVTIAGAGVADVPAFGRVTLSAPTGPHAVEVKSGDVVLESGSIDVHSGVDVLAYNVLGAGFIYDEQIVYAASNSTPSNTPPAVHCGQRVVEIDGVEFAFKEPPETMSVGKGQSQRLARHVDVLEGGALACAGYLLQNNQGPAAAGLLANVDEAVHFEMSVHQAAVSVQVRWGDPLQAQALADRGRAAADDSVDHHRLYQDTMFDLDARDEVVSEYTERRDRDRDSADAAYLLARAEPVTRGAAPFVPLVARFPKHVYLLRAHLYDRVVAGEYAEAVEVAKALRDLDQPAYRESIGLIAEALIAVGAVDEALSTIEKMFATAPDFDEQLGLATLHALVEQQGSSPAKRGSLFAKAPPTSTPQDTAKVLTAKKLARLPTPPEELRRAGEELARTPLELLTALESDPGRAVSLAETVPDSALSALPPATWALLYAESVRAKPNGRAVERLTPISRMQSLALSEFVATGEEDALLELEPSVRAAARIVRARVPGVSDATRQSLLSLAREEDILKTVVFAAAENWE